LSNVNAAFGGGSAERGKMFANPLVRLGSLVFAMVFIFTLVAAAWEGAPSFVRFVAENKAFFWGLGAGIVVAAWIRRPLVILAVVALAFAIFKLLLG